MSNRENAAKRGGTVGRVDATGRIVTRTAATDTHYRRKLLGLGKAARNALGRAPGAPVTWTELVDWFCTQDGKWSPKTVAQYRVIMRDAVTRSLKPSAAREELLDRIKTCPAARDGHRSSRRKSISDEEWNAFTKACLLTGSDDDRLALAFVQASFIFILRPVEWRDARIDGDRLVVRSAKASNGKGSGAERAFELDNFSSGTRRGLESFLHCLEEETRRYRGWKRFYDALSQRLRRRSNDAGLDRAICPYTCRHVGMSAAKERYGREVVALIAGHRATRSASCYARAGSSGKKIVPTGALDAVAARALRVLAEQHAPSRAVAADRSLPDPEQDPLDHVVAAPSPFSVTP